MKIDIFSAISINGMIGDQNGSIIFKESSTEKINLFRDNLRLKYDAILVGANTIIQDNPVLLNKNKNNLRIVIDKYGNLPANSNIFLSENSKTVVISNKFTSYNARNIFLDNIKPQSVINFLNSIGVQNLLIEGGTKTILEFVKSGFISKLKLITFSILITVKGTNLINLDQNIIPIDLKRHCKISGKYIYSEYQLN